MASTGTRAPRKGAPHVSGNGHAASGAGGSRDLAGLGREVSTAFYRIFPAMIVVVGLALVALVALWAVNASNSKASSSKAPSAAPYRITGNGTGHVVNVHLVATETVQEIAPDVKYDVWTFGGTAPGPVIRVHVGDTVHFTLTNDSTMGMDHSIDFHAAQTPWDVNYQPVHPGQSFTFDFVARFPGVFMYHCGTQPVLMHLANGMYGAIVVEPAAPLKPLPAAREYVLVSSEFYPGDKPVKGAYQGDLDKMLSANPQYVVFNGKAGLYGATNPLLTRPNELTRLWVLNAGPTLTNAFHVIGAVADHVYPDGNPTNVLNGMQTYNIPPGGGAMFEFRIPDAGLYPFVTHSFAFTGRGAVGIIKVTPDAPAAPTSYPAMGDPFSAGVLPAGAEPSVAPTGAPAPAATCEPDGTALSISAQNLAFSSDCLAVPAAMDFTIAFDNQDQAVPHNVAIYTDSSATTPLFVGDLVTGPASTTYQVPGLPAGVYFFRCDVHPSMNGTFIVKSMGH
jgi:copper-containing nitrite reductase